MFMLREPVCSHVWALLSVDRCVGACTAISADLCVNRCVELCVAMSTNICVDMCVDREEASLYKCGETCGKNV